MLREGAIYHVTARANRREPLLDPDSVKDLFQEVLQRAKTKHDFILYNFCIMGNHFHFLMKPGKGESLSTVMQWIMGVFAINYNKRNGLTGHFWGDRFFSSIVSNLKEYIKTFAYIDENPVKAGLAPHARDWRHGGLWHHRNGLLSIVEEASDFILRLFPDHRRLQLE